MSFRIIEIQKLSDSSSELGRGICKIFGTLLEHPVLWSRYIDTRQAALTFQRIWRGRAGRLLAAHHKKEVSATKIQVSSPHHSLMMPLLANNSFATIKQSSQPCLCLLQLTNFKAQKSIVY